MVGTNPVEAGGQIIEHHGLLSGLEEGVNHVAADVAPPVTRTVMLRAHSERLPLFACRGEKSAGMIIACRSSIFFAQSRRAWRGVFLPIPTYKKPCLSISSLE
jgi:hypothetical protein